MSMLHDTAVAMVQSKLGSLRHKVALSTFVTCVCITSTTNTICHAFLLLYMGLQSALLELQGTV